MNHNKESSEWIGQKLSALILLPLLFFFIYKINYFFIFDDTILSIAKSPICIFLIILFAIIVFYHAKIGFDVIIDDYIQCGYKKYLLKYLIKFVNLATLIIFIFASYSAFQKQELNITQDEITINDSSSESKVIIENDNQEDSSLLSFKFNSK